MRLRQSPCITQTGGLPARLDELLAEGNDGGNWPKSWSSARRPTGWPLAGHTSSGRYHGWRANCGGIQLPHSACGGAFIANAVQLSPGAAYRKLCQHPATRTLCCFDVETRRSAGEVGGWGEADKMGVSIAVAYDSADDAFHAYQQDELAGLFERMCAANLVIGFNSLRFDYTVLLAFLPPIIPKWPRGKICVLPSWICLSVFTAAWATGFRWIIWHAPPSMPQKREWPAGPCLVEGRSPGRN